jgi:hypothetical protein
VKGAVMIFQSPTWFAALVDLKSLSQIVAFLIGVGGFVQFYENFTWLDVLHELYRAHKQSKIEDKGMWGKIKRKLVHPSGPGLIEYIKGKVEEFKSNGNEKSEEEAQGLLLELKHWKFKAIIEGVFIMLGGIVSAALMLFSDDGEFSWRSLYLGAAELIIIFIIICRTKKAFQEKEEHFRRKYKTLLQFQSNKS